MDKHISTFTDQELISEIGECLALVGEVKARETVARKELLKRQLGYLAESGDMTPLENKTHVSMLKKEPITLAWLEREFGFAKADLPPVCFRARTEIVLDTDALGEWLGRQGHQLTPTYALTISKKKAI